MRLAGLGGHCVSVCLIMCVFMMCLCPCVTDHVCLHDVSVCLSMSAFGGVGWALCLCVSDHVCLHDVSVSLCD